MKESYDYEVKKKSREKIKSFIKSVFDKKQFSRLKVLTLLGHEDLELEQIWDPLGVNRRNITNVEKYTKVLKLSGNRGVENIKGDLEEVIEKINNPFDVICLDTVSPFTLNQREILRNISGRQLLGEKGVLITNYLGQREGGYHKEWFLYAKEVYIEKENPEKSIGINNGKIVERSELISRMVNSIMLDGITNVQPHPLSKYTNNYEQRVKDTLRRIQGPEWESKLGPSGFAGVHKSIGAPIIRNIIKNITFLGGLEKKYSPSMLNDLNEILFYEKIQPYFSIRQERYRYVGDRGSPMLMDINYFKNLQLSNIISLGDLRGMPIIIEKEIKKYAKFKKLFDSFIEGRIRCLKQGPRPREFLGSSYKPKAKKIKPKIEKQNAIYLLREGVPTKEILETYSGFTKMQLAAFKAHITMNTYHE